jgi:hypothetical protein
MSSSSSSKLPGGGWVGEKGSSLSKHDQTLKYCRELKNLVSKVDWPSYSTRMRGLSHILFLEMDARTKGSPELRSRVNDAAQVINKLILDIGIRMKQLKKQRNSTTSPAAKKTDQSSHAFPSLPYNANTSRPAKRPSTSESVPPAKTTPVVSLSPAHKAHRIINSAANKKGKRPIVQATNAPPAKKMKSHGAGRSQRLSSPLPTAVMRSPSSDKLSTWVVPTTTLTQDGTKFVFCGKERKKKNKSYYDAIIMIKRIPAPNPICVKVVFRPGDVYTLATGDPAKKDFLAFCTSLFYDHAKGEACMGVQWFYRYEELNGAAKELCTEYEPNGSENIFLSTETEVNQLETVHHRVFVKFRTDDRHTKLAKENITAREKLPSFSCNHFYSGNQKLTPLSIMKFKNQIRPCAPTSTEEIIDLMDSGQNGFREAVPKDTIRPMVTSTSSEHSKRLGRGSSSDFDAVPSMQFMEEKEPKVLKKNESKLFTSKRKRKYTYRIRDGSSINLDGSLTRKALQREKRRRIKGKFPGFLEMCAIYFDLTRHETRSVLNNPRTGAPFDWVVSQDTFKYPVSPKLFPDYAQIIKTPMYFHLIEQKLPKYESLEEFAADIRLMISNCYLYNPPDSSWQVLALADSMMDYFEHVYGLVIGQLNKSKKSTPSKPSSMIDAIANKKGSSFLEL